jgi:hypothetical protein
LTEKLTEICALLYLLDFLNAETRVSPANPLKKEGV